MLRALESVERDAAGLARELDTVTRELAAEEEALKKAVSARKSKLLNGVKQAMAAADKRSTGRQEDNALQLLRALRKD